MEDTSAAAGFKMSALSLHFSEHFNNSLFMQYKKKTSSFPYFPFCPAHSLHGYQRHSQKPNTGLWYVWAETPSHTWQAEPGKTQLLPGTMQQQEAFFKSVEAFEV